MKIKKKITDFITGKVTYDASGGPYLWVNEPSGGIQMLGELRGWGRIQNMIPDMKEAARFQDLLGQFVADAINEKIERMKQLNSSSLKATKWEKEMVIWWDFVTPEGEFLTWKGYRDPDWLNVFSMDPMNRRKKDELGTVWEIDFRTLEVKQIIESK